MSYQANEYAADMGMMLIPLDTALRELHAFVGNAETDGYIIFPSFGATQGVVAALYAVSQQICEVSLFIILYLIVQYIYCVYVYLFCVWRHCCAPV